MVNQEQDLQRTKEQLKQSEQTLQDREAELQRLREAEAELEAAQEKMRLAQVKLQEEKSAMQRRIAELEVQLQEEKDKDVVVEPDVHIPSADNTLSIDPAVVDSAEGTSTVFVYPDLYDIINYL
jgi:predicted nuclease with TOPRIM domain